LGALAYEAKNAFPEFSARVGLKTSLVELAERTSENPWGEWLLPDSAWVRDEKTGRCFAV
jgi:hypothetical protein